MGAAVAMAGVEGMVADMGWSWVADLEVAVTVGAERAVVVMGAARVVVARVVVVSVVAGRVAVARVAAEDWEVTAAGVVLPSNPEHSCRSGSWSQCGSAPHGR
jgi:hypothetical protein